MQDSFIPFNNDFSNAPKWKANLYYYEGDVIIYEGEVYEVLKNITSEENSMPIKSDDYLHMDVNNSKDVL